MNRETFEDAISSGFWGTLTRIPGSFFFLPLLTHEMWAPTRYHNSSYRGEKNSCYPFIFGYLDGPHAALIPTTMSSPAAFDVIRASIDHHKHIVQPQPTKMKSWWHIGFFLGWGLPLKFRIPEPKKVIFNCSGDDFYRREQLASQIYSLLGTSISISFSQKHRSRLFSHFPKVGLPWRVTSCIK